MKLRIIAITEAGEKPRKFSVTLPSGKKISFAPDAAQVDVKLSAFSGGKDNEPSGDDA